MRTLISIVAVLLFTTSVMAQEPNVEQLVDDQKTVQLFDVETLAKSFNLTNDQVVKIEVINAEVSKTTETVTQESYNKKLSEVFNAKQLKKWKKSIAPVKAIP